MNPSGLSAKGRFVTFEGGEGAGKSTQVLRLRDRLQAQGLEVIVTREPGGTPGAEAIRALLVKGDTGRWEPMTETLLHFAARAEHLNKVILPAIYEGKWVISDRFADSTMAYQGYAQGLGPEKVAALYDIVVGKFQPDLTLVLDIPVEAGLARAGKRDGEIALGSLEDRYERMGLAFHTRLRDAFLDIAAQAPERCVVIDTALEPDAVAAKIWAAVTSRLDIP
jgi:dTMP kinase